MSSLTTVLAIMVALEHLYIMFLESIVTRPAEKQDYSDADEESGRI